MGFVNDYIRQLATKLVGLISHNLLLKKEQLQSSISIKLNITE